MYQAASDRLIFVQAPVLVTAAVQRDSEVTMACGIFLLLLTTAHLVLSGELAGSERHSGEETGGE